MAEYHIAQLDIAKCRADMDDAMMAEFADNLDRINTLAEQSEGFQWRLKDDSGNATGIDAFMDPRVLINLSVWDSLESLQAFVYKTEHTEFLKRRQEWFLKLEKTHMVLWWVPLGHTPSVTEALQRLTRLRRDNETPYAFSFGQTFPASSLENQDPITSNRQ